MPQPNICVIGLGYIGLPSAALLAAGGLNVIGVDINAHIVETVNAGNVHITESGLAELCSRVVRSGNLRATTQPEEADVFIIAVPTPLTPEKKPDVQYVMDAARSLAPVLRKGNLVMLESTSPVGTTERVAQLLAQARPDLTFPQHMGENADIHVAYCPERVLPGNMLHELVNNDRVVGGLSTKAAEMASAVYKTFVRGDIFFTSARTAELCKLAENAFRDVNIAFANELSMLCDTLDVDVWELIRLANRHPRVNILQPGVGVGGHCIAIDPWFIVDGAPEQTRLIRTAREVNDAKPLWVVEKIKTAIADVLAANPQKTMADVTVACLGLTYKPDVGDFRESPALVVVSEVSKLGCRLFCVDPYWKQEEAMIPDMGTYVESLDDALCCADVAVILVKHCSYKDQVQKIQTKCNVLDHVGVFGNWQFKQFKIRRKCNERKLYFI